MCLRARVFVCVTVRVCEWVGDVWMAGYIYCGVTTYVLPELESTTVYVIVKPVLVTEPSV